MALFAFDGTWNREHTGADYNRNSNVVKFAKAYAANKVVFQKKGDTPHIVENRNDDGAYVSGPGTRHGIVGRIFGGVMGFGGHTRVNEAIKRAKKKFAEGDFVIDVIGFSRGAAIALHFVNELKKAGSFPGPDGKKVEARVRFVGLWDVVAAFGIPRDIGFLKFQETNIGWKLTLPDNVDRCFHAIAIDERRASFRVTLVEGAYQVWFRGVHSDIGGGNENTGLSDITLAWMLRKAQLAGVPIDASAFAALKPNPAAAVKHSKLDPHKDPFRKLPIKACSHHTCTPRNSAECQDPLPGWLAETDADEAARQQLVLQ